MNKEQILEKQIEALEKLIQLKDEIIKQLDKNLASEKAKPTITVTPSFPWATGPWQQGTNPIFDTCLHDYDYFTSPSRCKKCGRYNNITITSSYSATLSNPFVSKK